MARVVNIADQEAVAIVDELIGIETKIETVSSTLEKSVEKVDAKAEEAIAIAKETQKQKGPEGYTPVKGVDYTDGKDGENYVLTDSDKKEIAEKITVPVVEKVVETIVKEQPIVTEVTNNVENPVTPVQVREKLEALKDDERLDKSAVKGLENIIDQPVLDRAIGILDQRTSFLINKVSNLPTNSGLAAVSHDATLAGNGTPASPLTVTSTGTVTGSGTPTDIAFWDSSTSITSDPALHWYNTEKVLGVGTNTPIAEASQTWIKTLVLGATVSVVTAADAGAYGSQYDVSQTLTYKVVGYITYKGVNYYMTPTAASNTQTIANPGDAVYVSWSAADVSGYILVRDFTGDGYASYADMGNVTNIVDDGGNNFTWNLAAYPTSPNTLTFTMYGNTFDPAGLEYFSITDDDGFFRSGTGTFSAKLGVGTGADNPTPTALIISSDVQNTYPGLVISKDNSGLGTNNDIEFGRMGLVVHNPNGSSQTMLGFTTGSLASPTILGGLRVDHNGSYSWEALSSAGHYFWADGIGTEHICGFFSINGSANGYGLTVGSSTAPSGSSVLDVYGEEIVRGKLGITGNFPIVGSMDTMTYASTISLDVTKANLHKTTTVNATGNATINASAAGTAGQHIWVQIINDATSGKTITFGTNFKPSATVVGTTSKTAMVHFVSDGINWYEVARTLNL